MPEARAFPAITGVLERLQAPPIYEYKFIGTPIGTACPRTYGGPTKSCTSSLLQRSAEIEKMKQSNLQFSARLDALEQ